MSTLRNQTGVGVIDIIIGLFIGLIVVLATYSTLLSFQTFDRTGINSNSALENGITGLFAITHDLKMAGLGLLASGTTGCTAMNISYNGNTYATNIPTYAAAITDGGNNPDQVSVMYINTLLSSAPAYTLASASTSSGTLSINSALTLQSGQTAIISNRGSLPCTVVQITQIQNNSSSSTITFDAGSSPNTTYPANSLIAPASGLTWVTWRINNGTLEFYNNMNKTATTVADNIVQMQAQYGISNGSSANVQQWVDATGAWANLTSTTIAQIRAIRIAMVARSPQPEKPPAPGVACNTTTQAPLPWPGGTPIVLSADPNWQCYRYKVFKTVVPIENIITGGIS